MSLNERDWNRNRDRTVSNPLGGLSVNTWLIIINIAVFALDVMMNKRLTIYGHFSTHEVTLGGGLEFWRFLTFQFLHANVIHIFMNMFGLYTFGTYVESQLGSKRYLAFYLTCGVAGGLMYLLLNALGTIFSMQGWRPLPGLLVNNPNTPLVGASAGVFGIIMACAYISPHSIVQLFLLPIPIRMRTMAYVYVALSLLNLLWGGNNAGGDAAHIGGAVAGYFFIRNAHLLRDFFDVLHDSRRDWKSRSQSKKSGLRLIDPELDAKSDLVLKKIREQGNDSLTEEDKDILRRSTEQRKRAGNQP